MRESVGYRSPRMYTDGSREVIEHRVEGLRPLRFCEKSKAVKLPAIEEGWAVPLGTKIDGSNSNRFLSGPFNEVNVAGRVAIFECEGRHPVCVETVRQTYFQDGT